MNENKSKPGINVQDGYDEWAKGYDTDINPARDLNARTLREAALPLDHKRILEIGCGTGLNTAYLARHAAHVIGMDISENMLAKARKRTKKNRAEFVRGDITQKWPLESASLDFIVANLVLEHVKMLSHVYSEAWRVLSAGGRCYLAELHPYKQLQQSQAKYISPASGREVRIEAFFHSVSDYINEGLVAGFTLLKVAEHQPKEDDIPRLLTLFFEK